MWLLRTFTFIVALSCAWIATAPNDACAQYFRFGKNKVQYDDQEWFQVRSEHFNVYFYQGGQHLADYAAKVAEEAYRHTSRLFQYRVSGRIPIIVYLSHAEFAVTNAVNLPVNAEGIGGVTESSKNRIAVPFTGDFGTFRRVVHHELVHAMLNELFYGSGIQAHLQNTSAVRLPPWFSEGLAEFSASGWDTDSDMYVREAVLSGHLSDISALRGYMAYRGGQGVWDYIATQYGPEKIGEILQRLRSTRSVEASFRESIGLSISDLSVRWHRAVQEIYYPEVAAREPIIDIGKAIVTVQHGSFNSSPVLSPLGDKVAFVSAKNGLFDIYVASASDGTIITKLAEGQRSSQFESLQVLSPGLTWNPDGTQLAAAVKSGSSHGVVIMDIRSDDTRNIPLDQLDDVLSLSWSPDGTRLAISGTRNGQSDLYLLDLSSGSLQNVTNDLFSDHDPSWSPDGTTLLFHSDRGSHTTVNDTTPETIQLSRHRVRQVDIYTVVPGESESIRLTTDEMWDERSAHFSPDGSQIVFISDQNGIYNLYVLDVTTLTTRPLTDLLIGITQLSLAADGQRAAVVSLLDGVPSIYIIREPLKLSKQSPLRPDVWGQRVQRNPDLPPPSLMIATYREEIKNPFLREATSGIRYTRGQERLARPLAHRLAVSETGILNGSYNVGSNARRVTGNVGATPDMASGASRDARRSLENWFMNESQNFGISDSTGTFRAVDFRNYQFSAAFADASEGTRLLADVLPTADIPAVSVDANGNYVPRRYKLDFSPDIVYGSAGYDPLYGVQGVTQIVLSDILGNHRLTLSTNLLIDLRNADYIFSYDYLARRVDWSFSMFHQSRLLADFSLQNPTYFRYRQYGVSVEASYPFDKFRRLDLEIGLIGVDKADITDATSPSVQRTILTPRVTWTQDQTIPGFLSPSAGYRYAVSVLGGGLSFSQEPVQFATVMADFQIYRSFDQRSRFTLALRGSGAISIGNNRQLFYTSGVLNWINRDFDDVNGFPISNLNEFVFATPILPLRGFDINTRNGSRFALVNAEFRFPLIRALIPKYIPLLPFYNIHGQVFADIGGIWSDPNDELIASEVLDDFPGLTDNILMGTGFGIRTFLLGFPIRLDFAWPYDGSEFGDAKTYVSIGLDF